MSDRPVPARRRALVAIGPAALALAVVVLVYAVVAGAVLPRVAERMLPDWSRRTLGVAAQVAEVSFDPFRWRLEARGLRVGHGEDGEPDLAGAEVERLVVDLDAASLLQPGWIVSDVRVESPTLWIGRDASGRLALPWRPSQAARRADPAPREPTVLRVGHAVLTDGRVRYVDRSLQGAPSTSIGPVEATVDGFATGTAPGAGSASPAGDDASPARYAIRAELPRGGALEASGTLAAVPPSSSGHLRLTGVALDAAWPFVAPWLRLAPPGATLEARADYAIDASDSPTALTVSALHGRVGPLRLATAAGDAPLAELDAIALRDGRIAMPARRIALGELRLGPGRVAAAVGADGRLDWAALVPDGDARAAPGEPWRVEIDALRLERVAGAYVSRGDAPVQVEIASVDGGAAVSAATGGPGPRLVLSGLALQATDVTGAATDRRLRGSAGSARIDDGRFELDASAGGAAAWRFEGRAAIEAAAVEAPETGERLIGWRRLDTDAVTAASSPPAVQVAQARVEAPYARLRISETRELNLATVFGDTGGADGDDGDDDDAGDDPGGDGRARTANDAAVGPVRIRIDRVDFTDGTADFADRSLVAPFDVRVLAIRGSVAGLDTTDDARTVLEAEGEIRPFGQARATGTFHAFAPSRRTAIDVTLENVPMPILTPYLATFAGRTIDSGRLRAELEYRIVDGAISGQNRVVATNLSLGERVEAPNALDLPLDLAVAVLTDRSGRLAVEVPVSGRLGDPRFDYATLIREAIATVVRRVASAPFRALARLGGDGDASDDPLDRIAFEPGSDRLRPVQQERLSRLARALGDRPALSLRIDGAYDPRRDAAALRESAARRALARAMGIEAPADEAPGPVALEQDAVRAAIGRLLRERGLDAAAVDAEADAAWRRLVDAQPLPDAALQRLAAARARRVHAYLAQTQGLAADHLGIGRLVAVDAPDGRIPVPLALASGAPG